MSDAILARISPLVADDLDQLLGPLDDRSASTPGCAVMRQCPPLLLHAGFRSDEAIFIGLHLTTPPEFPAQLATRLAIVAAERNVEIIVLSEPEYSRLEPYGFRTERICGATAAERAAAMEQLKRFWCLQVILPA